jgi:nucleoside-diphosphate-sugar epimerase
MVLFTGITGHSGSWLLRRLSKEKYIGAVRCTVRASSDSQLLDNSGLPDLSTVAGDLSDNDFLDRAMKGVGTVLHIASIKHSPAIVEAAIRNRVQRAILVHTTGRYSKYKSAAEDYIRIEEAILALRDRISITILRPTMIYGSSKDQNMYKLIDYLYRHKFFPLFGSGNNLMQPVHASDLGNAYYDVLNNPEATNNREYNLPGKAPLKYADLVRTVSRTLGRKNILLPVPMFLSVLAARIYNRTSSEPRISVEQVMRMNEDKAFSYASAARDFGYCPLSFEEGIKDEVTEYLRANKFPL